MASFEELKLLVRKRLLSYRFAAFTFESHQAIVDQLSAALAPWLNAENESVRLTARSVAHYRAQSALRQRKSLRITECISCVLLPLGLLRWLAVGLVTHPVAAARAKGVRWNQSRFRYERTASIYHTPDELKPDAPQTVFVDARYLRVNDLRFLWRAARTAWPLLPTFRVQWLFKIAKELAFARPLIDAHPSEYALIDAECNCALSMLTLYSHQHGQQLFDVQHGDLWMSAAESFFETDRCYCWNDYYAGMLKRMGAKSDFRIYDNPTFLLSDAEKSIRNEGVGVFMPSSFTIPTDQEKQVFAQALNTLAERTPVHVRPHPAYAHECDAIRPLLSAKVEITDSRTENSKQFILRHEVIIGTTSAAVLEAIMLGKNVVCFSGSYLDDVARYHFAYQKPNCRICSLSELAETVLAQLQRAAA